MLGGGSLLLRSVCLLGEVEWRDRLGQEVLNWYSLEGEGEGAPPLPFRARAARWWTCFILSLSNT